MNHTIKVRHLFSKEMIQSIEQMQASVQRMVNSSGFKSMLKTAASFEKIYAINMATISSSHTFQNFQNTIEILGKNKNRLLASFIQEQAPKLSQNQSTWMPVKVSNNQKPIIKTELIPKSEYVLLEYQIKIKDQEIQQLKQENILLLESHKAHKHNRSKGGQNRHRKTTEIKQHIVKPMFLNKEKIKGHSVKQRAEKINCELSQVPTLSENELELFSTNYELNLLTLNHASDYFEDDRQEQIYKWCLAFSKEL